MKLRDVEASDAPPERPPEPTKAGPRLFFVDHLRVFLTVLVIVHHLAVTYSGIPLWYYTEATDSPTAFGLLSVIILVNQGFFMGLFFMISAYFAPGSVDRKGVGPFLKDRLLRLLIPLLVFYFAIGPVTAIGVEIYRGNGLPSFRDYLASLGFGPLWFIEALLVFTSLFALWRFLTQDRPIREEPGPPTYAMVAAFTLALVVVTFLWRTVVPVGLWVPVVDFPTLAYLPQYAGLFVVGVIAYRRDWFRSIPDSMGRAGFGMALGATVVFSPIALAGIPDSLGGGTWQSLFYALWDSTFCVGIGLGLLTLFRKRFDVQRRFGRFLSAHSYTVYVIHPSVIVLVAIALAGLDIYPLVKFGLAVAVGVPLCFAAAYLVRKLPFAARIL